MYVLGISSYSHESSCALLRDGEIRSLIEEERFNREKHTWKYPEHAIEQCLKIEGISFKDIDEITFFWDPYREIYRNIFRVLRYLPGSLNLFSAKSGGGELSITSRLFSMVNIGKQLQKQFGLANPPKVRFIEHHLCHAASAFFVSKFDQAAILTLDGRGESACTMFSEGHGNKIRKIKEIEIPHSLGHFFAAVTAYLGFRPFYDEYKVMGMSAYGNDTFCRDFEELIEWRGNGDYRLNLKYFKFHSHGQRAWLSDLFTKKFGPARAPGDSYEQRHFDLAFALQKTLEKTGVYLANSLYQRTQSLNLCMAGGVALNVLMNREIIRKTPFENFFFQPLATDMGTSLGSALYWAHQKKNQKRCCGFDTVYLGPEYSDSEIENILLEKKLNFKKSSNITAETAQHIAEGKIVGWFQGRMEAGPRALGNRSITVNPTNPLMKDRLNSRVKKREFFRPFAPSILEERVSDYFELPKNQLSPHMILAGDVKPDKREVIPAVTHVDHTARVHTVNKNSNPRYWQLLHEFEQVTGVPVLLNTSFNENEPIVCTPRDAVRCFLRTEFDVLAIGDYLVLK